MLHLIRVRTSRKWNHATQQCSFLLWHPGIQCRLRPEANSSGVPPSAYLPPIGCSAEHHTTGYVANTGVTPNSAGPDQAPRHAAPNWGRHRLYMSHIWDALMLLLLTFQQTMQAQTRRRIMRHPVRAGTDCICLYPTCG